MIGSTLRGNMHLVSQSSVSSVQVPEKVVKAHFGSSTGLLCLLDQPLLQCCQLFSYRGLCHCWYGRRLNSLRTGGRSRETYLVRLPRITGPWTSCASARVMLVRHSGCT